MSVAMSHRSGREKCIIPDGRFIQINTQAQQRLQEDRWILFASAGPSSACFYPVQVILPLGGADVKLELIRVHHPSMDLQKNLSTPLMWHHTIRTKSRMIAAEYLLPMKLARMLIHNPV